MTEDTYNRKRLRDRDERLVQSIASNLYDSKDGGDLFNSQEDWEKQAIVYFKSRKIDFNYEPELWCLTIIMAYPDYKRPYTTTTVLHFSTEKEALKHARKVKIDFFKKTGMIEDDDDYKNIDLESLEDKMYDSYYQDSYMDMSPIEIRLTKVDV